MREKKGLLLLLLVTLVLLFSGKAMAAMPNVTEKNTIRCYPWSSGKITLYEDESLGGNGRKVPYAGCDVTQITQKAAKLVLMNQNTKEVEVGWVPLKTIFYDPDYEQKVAYSNQILTLYKGPSVASTPYVGVNPHLPGVEVGKKGNWTQLIFYSDGQYYMGWLQETSYINGVRLSMETTGQVLADGIYTLSPRSNPRKQLAYDSKGKKVKLAKASSTKAQKFQITYKGNDEYLIVPVKKKSLALTAEKTGKKTSVKITSKSQASLWQIKRTGAYFYLYQKDAKVRMAASGSRVAALSGTKNARAQWKMTKTVVKPSLSNVTVFSQFDPKWGDATYMDGPSRRTISTSGCGLLALTNAVYALNGEFIPPTELAKFSVSRGHYFYNQGTADTLYADAGRRLGGKYHFRHLGKFYSISSLREHLQKNHTAIALVPGHYIAIVAYRKSDRSYLVLDSAVYNKRPTTIDGDWVKESALRSGYLYCEYFHIFSRR